HPVGPCPERQDQLVVGQFATFPLGGQMDHAPLQVDTPNRGLDEPGGPQKGTDGEGGMAHVKGAGKNLKQQRVMSRKLSRLTRTISTSDRRLKSPSRWRAV